MDGDVTAEGTMDVTLHDGSVTLIANLENAKAINRAFGGYQSALQKLSVGDIEAVFAIIRFGLGAKQSELAALEERVFRSGLLRLTGPCTDFVLMCANGGRSGREVIAAAGEPEADS